MNLLKKEAYFEKNGICTFFDFANELSYDELICVNGGCGGGNAGESGHIKPPLPPTPPGYEDKGFGCVTPGTIGRCGGGVVVTNASISYDFDKIFYNEKESSASYGVGTGINALSIAYSPLPILVNKEMVASISHGSIYSVSGNFPLYESSDL